MPSFLKTIENHNPIYINMGLVTHVASYKGYCDVFLMGGTKFRLAGVEAARFLRTLDPPAQQGKLADDGS